ncbi:MAG: response regulator transcription factor [Candidatus Aenigmarchaeota archaeon]|nr:response regulator transcription factor [Candidatus Aenigmarchaeota archaeon]
MHPGNKQRVLIVDDNPGLAELVGLGFDREGYEVVIYTHAPDGLEQLDGTYAVVASDLDMPVMDGKEFVEEARRRGYRGAIVVLSSNDREGADEYLKREHGMSLDAFLGATGAEFYQKDMDNARYVARRFKDYAPQ